MCLAFFSPANRKTIPIQHFHAGAENNSDGGGIAYAVKGQPIVVHRSMCTSNADVRELHARYAEAHALGANVIGHFRFATHGERTLDNCHPFVIGSKKQLAVVHNGILDVPSTKEISDTRYFVQHLLGGLRSGWHMNPHTLAVIGDLIGANKLALLDSEGNVRLVNSELGTWQKGVWYSNDGYIARRYSYGSYSFNAAKHGWETTSAGTGSVTHVGSSRLQDVQYRFLTEDERKTMTPETILAHYREQDRLLAERKALLDAARLEKERDDKMWEDYDKLRKEERLDRKAAFNDDDDMVDPYDEFSDEDDRETEAEIAEARRATFIERRSAHMNSKARTSEMHSPYAGFWHMHEVERNTGGSGTLYCVMCVPTSKITHVDTMPFMIHEVHGGSCDICAKDLLAVYRESEDIENKIEASSAALRKSQADGTYGDGSLTRDAQKRLLATPLTPQQIADGELLQRVVQQTEAVLNHATPAELPPTTEDVSTGEESGVPAYEDAMASRMMALVKTIH